MKRKTPLRRGRPLERKTPLEGASSIPPINRERHAKLRAEQFGTDGWREYCMAAPCVTCGAPPPSDPSHLLKTRGAGGKARDIVPQCRGCHDAVSAPGGGVATLLARVGLTRASIEARAGWLRRRFEEGHPPPSAWPRNIGRP